jgi:hypothetical protein
VLVFPPGIWDVKVAFSILPVILTCEGDRAVMHQFVLGFRNVRHVLKPPIVLIDQSRSSRLSGEYLAQVAALDPIGVFVHAAEAGISAYDSVQLAANMALSLALDAADERDYILFLEDDLLFSSRFAETVSNTYLGPETGFFTLYLPGGGYGSNVVDPAHFYGSQCLLFTRDAVERIVRGSEEMMAEFLPGYDIRWSRFLGHAGFTLYAADQSYVQHQPVVSRLHGHGSHQSNRFLP